MSGPVCQAKAFQFNNLEVTHCAFKSLRMCFSSCLLSHVGFTSEQFSCFLMNLVSFKNPALSQLVSLSHLYGVFTSSRRTPAVRSQCQCSLIKAERFTNIPQNQRCNSFGLLTPSYQLFFSSEPRSCGFGYFTMVLNRSQHLAALIPQSSSLLETQRKKNNRKEETFQRCCYKKERSRESCGIKGAVFCVGDVCAVG